jgi:hypothetical protein
VRGEDEFSTPANREADGNANDKGHVQVQGKAAISALTSQTITPADTANTSTHAAVGNFFLRMARFHKEDGMKLQFMVTRHEAIAPHQVAGHTWANRECKYIQR